MKNPQRRIRGILEFYYSLSPGGLTPLLVAALAARNKLKVASVCRPDETELVNLNLESITEADWVKNDSTLKKRINDGIRNGEKTWKICGNITSEISAAYHIVEAYDHTTVVREIHHRQGILANHSGNKESDEAHRKYALIMLAETLIGHGADNLRAEFPYLANLILTLSGIQPKRNRMLGAESLDMLLDYKHDAPVYNPFAGCCFAGSMLGAGDMLYADCDANENIYAAALLVNYGAGGDNENVRQRNSVEWIQLPDLKYILNTYRGFVNDRSAFEFCLEKSLQSLSSGGKMVSIASPRELFENPGANFKKALSEDLIESIALLPIGEVAVLVNMAKERKWKGKIKVFNLNNPFLANRPIEELLSDGKYASVCKTRDAAKRGFLKNLMTFQPNVPEDHELIRLGDIISKQRKRTYSLENIPENKKILLYLDNAIPYRDNGNIYQGLRRKRIQALFTPSYRLDGPSLIVNSRGRLEPRIFQPTTSGAYFNDGFAFKINNPDDIDLRWLIRELNSPFVMDQLFPYGEDELVKQPLTEEKILDLQLLRELPEADHEESKLKVNDSLPEGFKIYGNDKEYTIKNFLGHGHFGYAYVAYSKDLSTGEEKNVVLKELFPGSVCLIREEGRVIMADDETENFLSLKKNFEEEANIMRQLGSIPDSHIVPALEMFDSEETGTSYYVMPFYKEGSLKDLYNRGISWAEEAVIDHIAEPLCRALHVAHNERVLHLDIKPENVLMDENGDAILIDFGVARRYDNEGDLINPDVMKSSSPFAAPELKHGNMVTFGRQPDIFGVASTLYSLLTGRRPRPIFDFSDQKEDLKQHFIEKGYSAKLSEAILSGMYVSPANRPQSAQAFLNLFPGKGNIILK